MFGMFDVQFGWDIADSVDGAFFIEGTKVFVPHFVVDEPQGLLGVEGDFDMACFVGGHQVIFIEDDGGSSKKLALLSELIHFL